MVENSRAAPHAADPGWSAMRPRVGLGGMNLATKTAPVHAASTGRRTTTTIVRRRVVAPADHPSFKFQNQAFAHDCQTCRVSAIPNAVAAVNANASATRKCRGLGMDCLDPCFGLDTLDAPRKAVIPAA